MKDVLYGILAAAALSAGLVWLASKLLRRVVVHDYEAGLLYRKGRFARRLGAGRYLVLPFRSEIVVVDTRRRAATVPGQEVLTADHVGLKVSVALSYQVADAVAAVHRAQSWESAIYQATQLALRAAVGSARMEDLLAQRLEIGRKLQESLAPAAAELGVTLHAAELKDVMFPGDLKRIFAEVVRAQKEGQAALERARGETAALRNLANAAKMLEDNPALFNLRVLQSVSGGAPGSTVVIGVPQGVVPVARGPDPGRRGGGAGPDQG